MSIDFSYYPLRQTFRRPCPNYPICACTGACFLPKAETFTIASTDLIPRDHPAISEEARKRIHDAIARRLNAMRPEEV